MFYPPTLINICMYQRKGETIAATANHIKTVITNAIEPAAVTPFLGCSPIKNLLQKLKDCSTIHNKASLKNNQILPDILDRSSTRY